MIMNMSIEKMLSHVYEIEGLMLVTRRLGEENTPDVITNKIKRKVGELAEMCGVTLPAPEPTEKPEAPEPTEPSELSENSEISELSEPVEPLPDPVEPGQVPVADREPDDDITVEFIEAPDDDEPIVDEIPAEETPAAPEVKEEPEVKVAPEVKEEPAVPESSVTPPPAPAAVQPPVFCPHDDINDEPVPEPDPAMVPAADDEPDITVEFIEAPGNMVPEPEDEMPLPPAPTEFPEPSEPLRVDQKLQRDLSKDIRKAFSLNDRFRFQRELFAGSASAMNTAIEHIEVMTSYGNAELYFFSQLHWDRDNQDVKDFMEIVRNHFQHRANQA